MNEFFTSRAEESRESMYITKGVRDGKRSIEWGIKLKRGRKESGGR